MFWVTFLYGQITFYGEPQPVSALNSSGAEDYLFYDTVEDVLYFARSKYVGNTGGRRDNGDIWYATVKGGEVTSAQASTVNTEDFESPIGMMGTELVYSRLLRKAGSKTSGVMRGGELEHIPFYSNRGAVQSGSLSADGNYLILSMEGHTGYGVEDLYICKRTIDGGWSAPRNLGSLLNTGLQEVSPYLAKDNRTLIFASNGHGGEGSFDLFLTTRLDDTWLKWTPPVSLGPDINSPGAETSFAMDANEEFAYFVSTQNSVGYGDIQKIRIRSEIEPAEKDTVDVRLRLVPRRKKPVTSMQYLLIDKATGKRVDGIAIVMGDSIQVRSGEGGVIRVYPDSLGLRGDVALEFKSKGYFPQARHLSTGSLEGIFTDTLAMDPLSAGNVIALDHVLFERGTSNFLESSMEELGLVLEMLKENPEVGIYLKGHTDNVGNATLNLHLSSKRVDAVRDYLIGQGIASDRIDGKGYGGAEPIASNKSEDTRKLNRRVEFEVIRKETNPE